MPKKAHLNKPQTSFPYFIASLIAHVAFFLLLIVFKPSSTHQQAYEHMSVDFVQMTDKTNLHALTDKKTPPLKKTATKKKARLELSKESATYHQNIIKSLIKKDEADVSLHEQKKKKQKKKKNKQRPSFYRWAPQQN